MEIITSRRKMEEDSKKKYSKRAENYKKYRPHYPAEIINFLIEENILKKDSVIADIGSGTGLLSELFLENGNSVYCVEPNDNMRSAAEESFITLPNFRSIRGSAESTGLSNNQVDIITAATAFHWFDNDESRIEFLRILKTDGYVILIWNIRKKNANVFMKSYEEFMNNYKYGNSYKKTDVKRGANIRVKTFFSNRKFKTKIFEYRESLDFESLKGRTLSTSYIPLENDPNFSDMVNELKNIFDKNQVNGQIELLYDTEVYYGQL